MEILVFDGMKIFFVALAIFVIVGMAFILIRKFKEDKRDDLLNNNSLDAKNDEKRPDL